MTATMFTLLLLVDGRPPQAAPPTPEALFRAGVAAFDVQDYGTAARFFDLSYQLSQKPAILFDLGQSYRALGECKRALAAFDSFLETAPKNDPLLTRVRARRAEAGACVDPLRMTPGEGPVVPTFATGIVEPPSMPKRVNLTNEHATRSPALDIAAEGEHVSAALPTACAAIGGATAATGVIGMALGLEAWMAARDAESRRVWDSEAQTADARGHAFAAASTTILVISGIAATLTTAGCWWRWRHTDRAKHGVSSVVLR
jgi:tetratricopeptide (TPR) repeat protein